MLTGCVELLLALKEESSASVVANFCKFVASEVAAVTKP